MKRITVLVLPAALAAVALAQGGESAADLVKKLGDDSYEVREAATKQLVEMGEKAVPELEKALKSDDLEVRLRAGRALRAIRGVKPEPAPGPDKEKKEEAGKEEPAELGPGHSSNVVATELRVLPGKVKLKVTRMVDGERVVKEYEGKSIEDLKKNHPELKDVLGNFSVGVGRDPRKRVPGFDMERFWRDWGRDFDRDFWKDWQKDVEKEAERLRRLTEEWKRQWDQAGGRGNFWFGRTPQNTSRSVLGAMAARPSRVLDAQLGLRGRGLVMEDITHGSLAHRLGLERYDVLIQLNGKSIRSHTDVSVALKDRKPGDPLTAKVIRKAAELELKTK